MPLLELKHVIGLTQPLTWGLKTASYRGTPLPLCGLVSGLVSPMPCFSSRRRCLYSLFDTALSAHVSHIGT